jgi:voltage-gated potassium channel
LSQINRLEELPQELDVVAALVEHVLARAVAFIVLLPVGTKTIVGDEVSVQKSLRRRVYEELEPSARAETGISNTNAILVVLILAGTLVAILATEKTLVERYATHFQYLEFAIGFVFAIEYLARFWIAAEDATVANSFSARVRFILSPSALVDLVVIAATFSPLFVANLALLRMARLLRLVQLAKLGRMSIALQRLSAAIHSRRYELSLTIGLALALLLFGATGLYWLEGELQPEKFGSIPRSLWWAVITMTTIGYGDVYPITVWGKVVAAFVALAGIGLIAMPTGILAAAFSDAMQKRDDE